MKLTSSISIILITVCIFCCSRKNQIYISAIEIDGELTVHHNPAQTIDSIIIFNTGKTITTTGDSVYSITTSAEKRKSDSLSSFKKDSIPNQFAPPVVRQSFTMNENRYFSIIAYDTTGNEVIKPIEDKYTKGIYEVYFSIYSVLKPGTYILKMSNQMVEQHIKLKVNKHEI